LSELEGKESILLLFDSEMKSSGMAAELRNILEGSGFEVVEAAAPEEALSLISTRRPSVAILYFSRFDVARSVSRKIRAAPIPEYLPLLVIGRVSREVLRAMCDPEIFADDYLAWPISSEELLVRIHSMVRLKGMLDLLEEKRLRIEGAYRDFHRASREMLQLSRGLQSDETIPGSGKLLQQTQLHMAREIQKTLCPPRLEKSIGGLSIAARYVPTGAVGGDLYDVITLPEDSTGFFLADVAGHGLPSAFIAALTKMAFQMYALNSSPALTAARMNARLCQSMEATLYVTFFYAVHRPSSQSLTYVCAGHPPAILLTGKEGFQFLDVGGTVIGAVPEAHFDEATLPFKAPDRVLLFTDGLIECRGASGKRLGVEGVARVALRHSRLPLQEFVDRTCDDVAALAGEAGFRDDVTVVAVEAAR